MSLNDLMRDERKAWLNGRVENLAVDGNFVKKGGALPGGLDISLNLFSRAIDMTFTSTRSTIDQAVITVFFQRVGKFVTMSLSPFDLTAVAAAPPGPILSNLTIPDGFKPTLTLNQEFSSIQRVLLDAAGGASDSGLIRIPQSGVEAFRIAIHSSPSGGGFPAPGTPDGGLFGLDDHICVTYECETALPA